jgi:holliday junction DNA helicase RuvA
VISFLEGEVAERSGGRVVIAVGGVGYEVQVPASTLAALPPVGRTARIHTRMVVRDDAMTLFGFGSPDERELFDLLVTVNGIGPKVALSFLSVLSPDAFRRAVSAGDVAALTVVPGVGKKVAQRVVLDLKDRLGGDDVVVVDGPLADVREALLALGLSPQEASEAMAGLPSNGGRSTEDLLRDALQRMGGTRADGAGVG